MATVEYTSSNSSIDDNVAMLPTMPQSSTCTNDDSITSKIISAWLNPSNTEDVFAKSERQPINVLGKAWSLPSLPINYPMERSALQLDGLSLETVIGRIVIFLRMASIHCSFRSESGRIECTSPSSSMLRFVVQLWSENNNSHRGSIMEVQHRRGSSMEMHKLRLRLNKAVMLGTVADRAVVSTQTFNNKQLLPLRPKSLRYASLKRTSRTSELPQCNETAFPRYTMFREMGANACS